MEFAHSIEVWLDGALVGGLYGVALRAAFFGESMFSLQADASKLALFALCTYDTLPRYHLIDCQIESAHLKNLGAVLFSRFEFEQKLAYYCQKMPENVLGHCNI